MLGPESSGSTTGSAGEGRGVGVTSWTSCGACWLSAGTWSVGAVAAGIIFSSSVSSFWAFW